MPTPPSLESLGSLISEKRGRAGLRATAAAIGVSPATLSRIENGHLPDLANFRRICHWLEIDPAAVLGFDTESMNRPVVSVHFRKTNTMSLQTGSALAEMIQAAHAELIAEESH